MLGGVSERRQTAGRRLAPVAGALLALALTPAVAAGAASVSSNWAGYVATARGGSRTAFSSVSGVWTQPAVSCPAGRESYSATWVGLGGYGERSRALEQAGTDANCSRSGHAAYAAWYELLPAAPTAVRLAVHPGDLLVAAVTVSGRHVNFAIRDLTSGTRFAKTVHASATDLSSAEWIVEAPSACVGEVSCRPLALADFGQVGFAHATATAGGRTGPAGSWAATALELHQRALQLSAAARRPQASEILAVPSSVSSSTGAFGVSWLERQLAGELPPAPTLPGG
jgi:hypothetical protein